MLTAFGQTAFGQFWCFNSLAKISVVVVVIVFSVVVGLLVPGGAWWCLVVPGGAWWCLLVLVGGCCLCVWWVCSRFWGLSPGPPYAGPPSAGPPKFRSFSSLSRHSFCVSLGVFSWNFGGVFEGQNP